MHYTKSDIVGALREVGIKKGDIIFSHMNLGFFGIPDGGLTEERLFKFFYEAIFEVLGDEGLLIVPTFTYSFTKGEIFDPDGTPSKMGLFPEMLRKLKGSVRTLDPIFSVCLHGNIKKLFKNGNVIISTECFGKGSIWDFMLQKKAKICNFNLDAGSTFIHYVEKLFNVPYRYDKDFEGITILQGKEIPHRVTYFVRDLNYFPNFPKFDRFVREKGYAKMARVGRGSIVSISCQDVYKAFKEMYEKDRYALAKPVIHST
jgi:aminoglycoside 3-N-acetyltransferase